MICRRCLHRASALRSIPVLSRTFASAAAPTNTSTHSEGLAAATSTGAAQPFSTPLTPSPSSVSAGTNLRPKAKAHVLPVSAAVAGLPLKGLNFIKGREDPLALPEEEYPEWLWRCLDAKSKGGDTGEDIAGDEFSKSKKQRRMAAKRQKKAEALLIASGEVDLFATKIPLQQQTIDLPVNEDGSVGGFLQAADKRGEVTKAMREERRSKIKEANFLTGMR